MTTRYFGHSEITHFAILRDDNQISNLHQIQLRSEGSKEVRRLELFFLIFLSPSFLNCLGFLLTIVLKGEIIEFNLGSEWNTVE